MVLSIFAIMLNRCSAHDWLRNSGLYPIAAPEICHGSSQFAPQIYEQLSQQSVQVLQKPPGIYFIMRIYSAIIISFQFISEYLAHFLSGQSSSKSTSGVILHSPSVLMETDVIWLFIINNVSMIIFSFTIS